MFTVGCNSKSNPGIDFYSGFRKTSQRGGGTQYQILKKVRPPPPPLTPKPGSATAAWPACYIVCFPIYQFFHPGITCVCFQYPIGFLFTYQIN